MNKLQEQIMNFDWSLKSIVKASLGLLVVVIALSLVLGIVRSATSGFLGGNSRGYTSGIAQNFVGDVMESVGFDGYTTTLNSKAMGIGGGVSTDMAMAEPGILPPYPYEEGGDDAEEYERRDYSAQYETRKFEETCTAISDLKPLEYVVFDNSSKSEDWCHYTFRVEVAHEEEVLATLRALDPRDLNINTSTIERSVEYTDSELVMQQRRLESLQETLTQAESSFNSLITQARASGDTATLSEVINNKINTVDRLNQEILNAQDRVDRLTRNREGQTDQIDYAHFNVSVSKVTFFDGDQFADEWKRRVQELFFEVNATLLALTVGLVSFVLGAVQFVIFAGITVVGVIVFAKIVWMFTKRIWNWKKPEQHSVDIN